MPTTDQSNGGWLSMLMPSGKNDTASSTPGHAPATRDSSIFMCATMNDNDSTGSISYSPSRITCSSQHSVDESHHHQQQQQQGGMFRSNSARNILDLIEDSMCTSAAYEMDSNDSSKVHEKLVTKTISNLNNKATIKMLKSRTNDTSGGSTSCSSVGTSESPSNVSHDSIQDKLDKLRKKYSVGSPLDKPKGILRSSTPKKEEELVAASDAVDVDKDLEILGTSSKVKNVEGMGPQDISVSGASIPKDMSSLSDSVSMYQIPTDYALATKNCLSPIMHRRFGLLRKLKSAKSGTSSKDSLGSFVPGSNLNTDDAFAHHLRGSNKDSRNAYVAYFRRSESAKDSIRLYEHPTPASFPTLDSEVVVHIEASTVSKVDCAVRRGLWWNDDSDKPLNLPIIPGVAFCGRIMQTGKGASKSGLKQGDRVISLVRVGASARHLCIEKDKVVRVPPGLNDPAVVSCLPEVYLTAFQVLHTSKKNAARYRKTSLKGKAILLVGGASHLGYVITELACAAGAGTVYCPAKEKCFAAIEAVGGVPLNKDPCHWYSLLLGRIDLVIALGNDDPTKVNVRPEHTQVMNKDATLVSVVPPGQDEWNYSLEKIDSNSVGTNRKLYLYNVFDSWDRDMKTSKRDLNHLLKLLVDGMIKPKIIERISLNKVAKAQDLLEVKKPYGFVVCEPWTDTSSAPPDIGETLTLDESKNGKTDKRSSSNGKTTTKSGYGSHVNSNSHTRSSDDDNLLTVMSSASTVQNDNHLSRRGINSDEAKKVLTGNTKRALRESLINEGNCSSSTEEQQAETDNMETPLSHSSVLATFDKSDDLPTPQATIPEHSHYAPTDYIHHHHRHERQSNSAKKHPRRAPYNPDDAHNQHRTAFSPEAASAVSYERSRSPYQRGRSGTSSSGSHFYNHEIERQPSKLSISRTRSRSLSLDKETVERLAAERRSARSPRSSRHSFHSQNSGGAFDYSQPQDDETRLSTSYSGLRKPEQFRKKVTFEENQYIYPISSLHSTSVAEAIMTPQGERSPTVAEKWSQLIGECRYQYDIVKKFEESENVAPASAPPVNDTVKDTGRSESRRQKNASRRKEVISQGSDDNRRRLL